MLMKKKGPQFRLALTAHCRLGAYRACGGDFSVYGTAAAPLAKSTACPIRGIAAIGKSPPPGGGGPGCFRNKVRQSCRGAPYSPSKLSAASFR
jgi:hypothetical protein